MLLIGFSVNDNTRACNLFVLQFIRIWNFENKRYCDSRINVSARSGGISLKRKCIRSSKEVFSNSFGCKFFQLTSISVLTKVVLYAKSECRLYVSICEIHEKFENIWTARMYLNLAISRFQQSSISLIDVRFSFHKFVFNMKLRELYLSSLRKIINNFISLHKFIMMNFIQYYVKWIPYMPLMIAFAIKTFPPRRNLHIWTRDTYYW